MRLFRQAILVVLFLFGSAPCMSDAPTLYSTAGYESPVEAEPDDLLLLTGKGFQPGDTVVYRVVDETSQSSPPDRIPDRSDAILGVAQIASMLDAPDSMTVRLPLTLKPNQPYALWVVNLRGEWSNAARINDPRPLWLTPDEMPAIADASGIPRVLKVVGRNMQPPDGASVRLRLVGAHVSYALHARAPGNDSSLPTDTAVRRYVAEFPLPAKLKPGTYRAEFSRDGLAWVPLIPRGREMPQVFSVMPDPAGRPQFEVGEYSFGLCPPLQSDCASIKSPCHPDGGSGGDQSACITAAIRAAQASGGGTVIFGPGAWRLNAPGEWARGHVLSTRGVSYDGILVPHGVNLRGAGAERSTIVRGANWPVEIPSFALRGHNEVSGLTFRDERVYGNDQFGAGFLSLGVRWDRVRMYGPNDPMAVSHVVITANRFDKPFIAVAGGGLSIDHLRVTKNIFGAFYTALFWEGNIFNTSYHYSFSDSIVAQNTFYPGSYLDTKIGQGTIATALSGGRRIDFSQNVADGTSSEFLNDPKLDAKGWRAAFFWSMHDNVEMMLVSQNQISCSGDKDGDGEAIAYDNNHNRPGFGSIVRSVIAAHSDSAASVSNITVPGPLLARQADAGRSVGISNTAKYYIGDWVQVVQGAGIGQARKIQSIEESADGGKTISIGVSPAFDVLPPKGGLITVGRLYWQVYTIANVVEQRAPPCLKSNRTRRAGGLITVYGQTTDSAVEGNTQFDTSGISVVHQFQLLDPAAGVSSPVSFVQSFNEVRRNLIDGTYDASDQTRQAEYGIAVTFAATPHTDPPPILSYGLTIAHNSVLSAAGKIGAISFNQGWYTGPPSRTFIGLTPWKLADATLIFNNSIFDDVRSPARRIGIGISAGNPATPVEWRTVLYGNRCMGLSLPNQMLDDLGTQTVRHCPLLAENSCECGTAAAEIAVSLSRTQIQDRVGALAPFEIMISNKGIAAASGLVLTAQVPAGLSIVSLSAQDAICNVGEATAMQCRLGSLQSGQAVAVAAQVQIIQPTQGRIYFSVAQFESERAPLGNVASIEFTGLRVSPSGEK